jgi:hypothetical protein
MGESRSAIHFRGPTESNAMTVTPLSLIDHVVGNALEEKSINL